MKTSDSTFFVFAWRIMALHLITYFFVGLIAMNLMHYKELFSSGSLSEFMRPTEDPITALGPAMQLIRGFIFALVLWPIQTVFLSRSNGWQKLWGLFAGLGILSTFGPALGSIDGFIYTQIPLTVQIQFLPELFLQSGLLSFLFISWYHKPRKVYNIIAVIAVTLIVLMSFAGYVSLSQ